MGEMRRRQVASGGFSLKRLTRVRALLEGHVDSGFVPGIVAACAMALVEDGTLSLDDQVDDFLPELGDMTVLVDPGGPLEETVAAKRPITLRDLLTFTLGTGMVPAQPGTVPISDALNALQGDEPGPPDEWIRRLGTLPLVYQPGERWMYHTAADVTGVLIARA